jgi:hypothetical protein
MRPQSSQPDQVRGALSYRRRAPLLLGRQSSVRVDNDQAGAARSRTGALMSRTADTTLDRGRVMPLDARNSGSTRQCMVNALASLDRQVT